MRLAIEHPDLLRRCALVFGTRPEAIKLGPLRRALTKLGGRPVVVFTGQQRLLGRQAADALGLTADVDLDLMREAQDPGEFLGRAVTALTATLKALTPSCVIVQGDTASALAGALAARYARVPLAHVEAGLRTGDPLQPFPEEMQRRAIGSVADYHFCPTGEDRANLRAEGVRADRIAVVGNTVIDAVVEMLGADAQTTAASSTAEPFVLVTTHRRENIDGPLRAIIGAIRRLAQEYPDVRFVMPVHPNPAVVAAAAELDGLPNVQRIDPLPYPDFLRLLQRARFAITDSGGLQEESPWLGKPLVVVRRVTERPHAVAAGAALLAGVEPERIVACAREFLSDSPTFVRASRRRALFGDGRAALRIAQLLAGASVEPFAGATTDCDEEVRLCATS